MLTFDISDNKIVTTKKTYKNWLKYFLDSTEKKKNFGKWPLLSLNKDE